MTNYVLIDTHNLFHRAKHISRGDADMKTGMALHIIFTSLRKVWKQFDAEHLVFCLDHTSWRKDYYPKYKLMRKMAAQSRTLKEQELDEVFQETIDDFIDFLKKRTNATILHRKRLEADDLIAGWIQRHPNDTHVIVSSDSDFEQLVSDNVNIFNPLSKQVISLDGYHYEDGTPVIDKKTKKPKKFDPRYNLFFKCIRGDKTDGIFSAYPGVFETKIKDAYENSEENLTKGGYSWNNLMLTEWKNHEGKKVKVQDAYDFNRRLIDLTYQPDDVKNLINEVIDESYASERKGQVGIWLMNFCEKHNLVSIGRSVQAFGEMFQATNKEKEEVK